jgi:hypothetical protein
VLNCASRGLSSPRPLDGSDAACREIGRIGLRSGGNRSGPVHEPVRFPPQTIFTPQQTDRFDKFTSWFF